MAYLTRVKTKLAIPASRKVSGLLDGQYASVHGGRSLDFADLREYAVGDDVKDLDWKATARHGKPLVKRYVADRKHTVMLTIATGRTMAARSTTTQVKVEVALMAAGLVGYLATRHGDYVGMVMSKGDKAEAIRPSMREIDVERMLSRAAGMCTVDSPDADLGSLLSVLLAATHRRNIVLLVVDDVDFSPVEEALLKRVVVQHQVLLITVGDLRPTDREAAELRLLQLDTRSPVPGFAQADDVLAREIARADADRQQRRADLCAALGIAHEQITSSDEVIAACLRLLERTRRAAR